MDRRGFITATGLFKGGASVPRNRGQRGGEAVQGGAGLEPYTGPWGADQAMHLLRRSLFGLTKSDVATALALNAASAVDRLLESTPPPTPPTAYVNNAEKTGWTTEAYVSGNDATYQTYLLSWWMDLMLSQGFTLREKMVLFWHNHFATGAVSVKDARYMYKQNALFRENAFGNFRSMVRMITFDPAMLRYLNGNANKKGAPNENYARELQELFTIGKGPERAPGDYTNYTEADIKAAARVLTGWSDESGAITAKYTAANHDTGDKTFSAAYGGRVITGGSSESSARAEIDALIDMIFEQPATALYFCRKLYRWFVDYVIDDQTETEVIAPMAALLRASNYEVKPVLAALLKSRHFHEGGRVGCVIKNPVEITIGVCRTFEWIGVDLDDSTTKPPFLTLRSSDRRQYNWRLRTLRRLMANMGMDLMNPPNVAGWPAYWQSPSYHELWVNADTLQKRVNLLDDISINGIQWDEAYGKGLIDVIAFVKQLGQPNDPNAVINETARLLFPMPLTDAQRTTLNDILLPGLPDYEWDVEWSDYVADSTNETKRKTVEDKLRGLFNYMLTMAEYQLS